MTDVYHALLTLGEAGLEREARAAIRARVAERISYGSADYWQTCETVYPKGDSAGETARAVVCAALDADFTATETGARWYVAEDAGSVYVAGEGDDGEILTYFDGGLAPIRDIDTLSAAAEFDEWIQDHAEDLAEDYARRLYAAIVETRE